MTEEQDEQQFDILWQLVAGEITMEQARVAVESTYQEEHSQASLDMCWRGLLAAFWKGRIGPAMEWYQEHAKGVMWWDKRIEEHHQQTGHVVMISGKDIV